MVKEICQSTVVIAIRIETVEQKIGSISMCDTV